MAATLSALTVDVAQYVFLDECGVTTDLPRRCGRRREARAYMTTPRAAIGKRKP